MNPSQFTFSVLNLALFALTTASIAWADAEQPKRSESELETDEIEMRSALPPERDDCEWAWKELEVDAAHRLLFENGKALPGSGIKIAHIDTGVIPFPALQRSSDSGKTSAGLYYRAEPGISDTIFNFVQPQLPPLDNNNKGLNFGHGTETASLIVGSLATTNITGWSLRGLAPWAKLYPIKVTDSVVMVGNISTRGTADLSNLAAGIEKATQMGAHVITISLGAIFDSQNIIRKSIDSALDAGSIVIAAAGQTIPMDVIPLPAKLPGVVAVTASTRSRNHWESAFSGKNIAWAAPGENVCHLGIQERRTTVLQNPNAQSFQLRTRGGADMTVEGLVRMSSGTSYSTAFTAGAATLWLQHHNPALLAQRYGQKNISRLFLAVAKNFATDVPPGWNTQRHGSGILNVRKLLQAPLPCSASDSDTHCAVKLSRFLTTASR